VSASELKGRRERRSLGRTRIDGQRSNGKVQLGSVAATILAMVGDRISDQQKICVLLGRT
jgi:hypothetical protein